MALKLKYELPKVITSLARGCISGDNMNHSLIIAISFTISGRRDLTQKIHTTALLPTVPWLQFRMINNASYTLPEALSFFKEGATGKNKTN